MLKFESRLFSRKEANELLPKLTEKLNNLRSKRDGHTRAHDILFMHELLMQVESADTPKSAMPQDLQLEIQELEASIQSLDEDLQEILEMGCILRDIEQGWIDVPGRLGDEEIFFCWKLGEEEVLYFRRKEQTFEERQLLN